MAFSIAIPGQTIGTTNSYTPGPGTHLTGTKLTASIVGLAVSKPQTPQPSGPATISVVRPTHPPSRPRPHLPTVGSVVYTRITRLQPSTAHAAIVAVDDVPVPAAYAANLRGILRAVDVRATEKDRVRLADCFAVGDVVRAVVVSIGDTGGYFISTAGNEYGVVVAWSREGNACVPVSWCEVKDAVTGEREPRKVAKPF